MHFDKTGQCSGGRISLTSKASISLGCDSWGLVGDTKLRENTRINDNLNTELVFTIHLHITHELLAKFGPKFAWSSHTCSANIAWHMRDSRTTLAQWFAQQNWEFWALATVARRSRECRATVEWQLCVRIEKGARLLGGARLLESARLLRLLEGTTIHCISNQSQFSFIGRQPLTKLPHILALSGSRRLYWEGFETPATTLWLFWDKVCCAIFLFYFFFFFIDFVYFVYFFIYLFIYFFF